MIYTSVITDIQKYLEASPSTKTWINLTVQGLVSNLINLILIIAFVVFLFLLLTGGVQWITSGGDKESIAKARGKITSALVGVIIVLSAWAILNLVKYFFGLLPHTPISCAYLNEPCSQTIKCCKNLYCEIPQGQKEGRCRPIPGKPIPE